MDPYKTLGVGKGCTRDALKEAFRAQAQRVHPDRGGDPAAFIRLREAFDQVSAELNRRPPEPRSDKREPPPRHDRGSNHHDPNWEPEIVILDEPLARIRPARSRDPDWEPELILVDEEPRPVSVSTPLDPRLEKQNYIRWLKRISTRTSRADASAPDWNLSGVMAVAIAVFLTVWICWAAWWYEYPIQNAGIATKFDPTSEPEEPTPARALTP